MLIQLKASPTSLSHLGISWEILICWEVYISVQWPIVWLLMQFLFSCFDCQWICKVLNFNLPLVWTKTICLFNYVLKLSLWKIAFTIHCSSLSFSSWVDLFILHNCCVNCVLLLLDCPIGRLFLISADIWCCLQKLKFILLRLRLLHGHLWNSGKIKHLCRGHMYHQVWQLVMYIECFLFEISWWLDLMVDLLKYPHNILFGVKGVTNFVLDAD